jgi:hypothetical protein
MNSYEQDAFPLEISSWSGLDSDQALPVEVGKGPNAYQKHRPKRSQMAKKTLKNSNKQQQTWMRGSQVVQSSKMLSGLGSGKIVGKGKRLPPIL